MFAEKEDSSFEDANLFYVAMTRAKKRLTLTSAPEGLRDFTVSFASYDAVRKLLDESSPEVEVEIVAESGVSESAVIDDRVAEFLRKSWSEGK